MPKERRKRISLDFDGVLHSYTSGYTGMRPMDPPVKGAVAFVTWLTEQNWDIYIFTARMSTISDVHRDLKTHEEEIRMWLEAYGFPMQSIKYVGGQKPAADLYVDDNGYRFDGDFTKVISGINSSELLIPWYKVEPKGLSEHDRTCNCPGAQTKRHMAGKRKPEDDMPLLGCNCRQCSLEWELYREVE